MIAAKVLIGIDVSRDWLDGFLLPDGQRFRLPNSAEGHAHLIEIRALPTEKLQILRTLTTHRAQLVGMRKRLALQISARTRQAIPAQVDSMDDDLKALLDTQIFELERRIERVITQEKTLADKAVRLSSVPGIGPVSAAMLIAEMPELGKMTSGEVAAMTGLAPVPYDSGTIRGKRMMAGGRRALRHVLYQAALTVAYHNPVLKSAAQRLKERGKPHKLIIVAVARRLATIANAILKSGASWSHQNPT